MAKGNLGATAVFIDGKYFRVMDFPFDKVAEEGPLALKKAIAYRYETDVTKGLYPYRGIFDIGSSFNANKAEPGIWFYKKKGQYKMRIVRPHTMAEKEEYSLGREKNIVVAVMDREYAPDQFMDTKLGLSDIGSEVFMPPLHRDDDPLNALMKLAIRAKEAPFDPYGTRLESLAIDRKAGAIEGVNIRNNAKRAITKNTSMSPSKAVQYADTWQLEMAIIIKDVPGSMHPMFNGDEMMVMFPSGIPFPIDQSNLVDVRSMISAGIAESSGEVIEDEDEF